MQKTEMKNYIGSKDFFKTISDLYMISDEFSLSKTRDRYEKTFDKAVDRFSDGDYHIISSPGRAEICGNHTDHQNGFVVATALDIDNICFAKKTDSDVVRYIDEHFDIKNVDVSDLAKKDDEINKAESIIRGIAKRLTELGYKIGGFDAFCDSRVLAGSSMSSSACFEVMVVEIFNYFYNDGKINDVERAKISQWAENNYFGKPCGLMDQMAISVGNFVGIDFFDKENPNILKHDFSFSDYGYDFFIVDTKGSHADLTDEYIAIPSEMASVAKYFSKEKLSDVEASDFYSNIEDIREKIKNDRAILRAHHFFTENDRAKKYNELLDKSDIRALISIMNESGDSSYKYLQNVYPSSNIKNQAISIALAISKSYIGDGACRVMGGGFAGTIQVIIKKELSGKYVSAMNKIYGDDSVLKVKIRKYGTKTII